MLKKIVVGLFVVSMIFTIIPKMSNAVLCWWPDEVIQNEVINKEKTWVTYIKEIFICSFMTTTVYAQDFTDGEMEDFVIGYQFGWEESSKGNKYLNMKDDKSLPVMFLNGYEIGYREGSEGKKNSFKEEFIRIQNLNK